MPTDATPPASPAPENAAPAAPAPAVAGSTRRQFVLVWLAVSLVAVLSHFFFAPRMGLYEDDHWMIGVPMCDWQSPSEMWAAVKSAFVTFFQGRPLHCGFGYSMAYTGTHLGGIVGAYALASAVWSLNAGLCLALLWKRFGPLAATTASLVFVLLPADSTHPMLHTTYCVHTSQTFLLLSGLAYSRGWRLLALPIAALSLLTYETCFLPALVWPILFWEGDRAVWRRILIHGVGMGAMLALVLFARVQLGENRVSEAMGDKQAVGKKVRELVTVGPWTALKTFRERPVWVVKTMRKEAAFARPGPSRLTVGGIALGATAAAMLALFVAWRVSHVTEAVPAPAVTPTAHKAPDPETTQESAAKKASPLLRVGNLLIAGAMMVVLSYVASVTRDPTTVNGRMSSVHIGSTVGWGVFFAGVVAGLSRALGAVRAGGVVVALVPLLAVYFGLLSAFHVCVQREYVRAWIAQGEFWHDVAHECPDVRAGTIILYPLVKRPSEMVYSQEWADYLVFPHLFAVPSDWPAPPRAFPVGHNSWGLPRHDYKGYDWSEIEREGDKLYLKHWGGVRVELVPGNVILLRHTPEGHFERMTGTVPILGVDLQLKPRTEATFKYEPARLFSAMFPHGLQTEPGRRVLR